MLSGYLLMYHHQNDELDFKYIIRKIKKFYPLHLITLIIAAYLFYKDQLLSLNIPTIVYLICNLLLVQSWLPTELSYFAFNSVSWYLSLMVFFVLASVPLVKLLRKLNKKQALVFLVAIVIFEHTWTYLFQYSSNFRWIIYILPVIRLLDYIGGGASFLLQRIAKPKSLVIV